MFSVFLNGIFTGFLLQIAVGPVFFYILNLSIQRTTVDGLLGVIAVTLADYFYIILSVIGAGKLLEKSRTKTLMGIISSIVLIIFGVMMIITSDKNVLVNSVNPGSESNYLSSFLSSFFLTISSPMTIVFWTGLFAAKAIEKNYSKRLLIVFGLSAGFATLIFLGLSVMIFSLFKTSISAYLVHLLNIIVGVILIIYALIRIIKLFKSSA